MGQEFELGDRVREVSAHPMIRRKICGALLPILLALSISACSTQASNLSGYKVMMQPRPKLQIGMRVDPACYFENGAVRPCVWFAFSDWEIMRLWMLKTERELRAACLSNGQGSEECMVATTTE